MVGTLKINLSVYEARVIGSLIEKEITTPEQYPLSLNALTNACNQKSSRDPVLDLDEAQVLQTLDGLAKKFLVSRNSGFGSRVTKFQHRFCNTEFGELQLSKPEVAIICELLLRGPQTPGELRARTERLYGFGDVSEVEAALIGLQERDEPLVAKLPREPGKRESRYVHLFSHDVHEQDVTERDHSLNGLGGSDKERIETLEQLVRQLRLDVDQLKQKFEEL